MTDMILHYGLLIVFLNVVLEQIGLPLPTYPTLILAGALSIDRGAGVPALIATAVMATMAADLLWYSAGARFGQRMLGLLCRLSLSPDSCVHRTETSFERIGPGALLLAKYIPGAGPIAVCMSGVVGISLPLFLLLDLVGAPSYVALPVLLGRIFHDAIGPILATLASFGIYTAIALPVTLAIFAFIRWKRRNRLLQVSRSRASAWRLPRRCYTKARRSRLLRPASLGMRAGLAGGGARDKDAIPTVAIRERWY